MVLKDLKPPYLFQLRAQNEWTSAVGGEISAGPVRRASVPGSAQFSVAMRIRGRAILQEVRCTPETSCVEQRTTPAGLPVVVLTQPRPRARWTPAGRGITSTGGYYDIRSPPWATRPYMVTVPLYSGVGVDHQLLDEQAGGDEGRCTGRDGRIHRRGVATAG